MKTGIVLLWLILLLLLAAVIPVADGRSADALYHSPVMIALLGLLAAACVWCCWRKRKGWRLVGFLLAHLGVVLLLVGGMTGFLFGVRTMIRLPLQPEHHISSLTLDDQHRMPLGFQIAARDFQVDFYPPSYVHWHPLPPSESVPGEMPFRPGNEFETENENEWELGEGQTFAVSNLWNAFRSEWLPQYPLPDGSVLALARQTPTFFGFTLLIWDGAEQMELPVAVNQPAKYAGWIFYLISYDARGRSYVDISVRRDPGRAAVIAGIWMLITGVFILSFRRLKEASDGAA